jgi:hypothetical protein
MQPMLTQRTEQLLIEKCTADPDVNDVVLFRRSNGQYVLHRIIGKRGEHYLIRGDNCYGAEKVRPQQIIGILKGFYKDEKFIDCKTDKRYRRYIAFWRVSYPLRFAAHRCLRPVRKAISILRR